MLLKEAHRPIHLPQTVDIPSSYNIMTLGIHEDTLSLRLTLTAYPARRETATS
jgi:hypothetical protein